MCTLADELPTPAVVASRDSAARSQPVWIWDWLDWPVARSTAYSSYHQSWYGARFTSLPGAKAATPLPSAALARPKRTRFTLTWSYSEPGYVVDALRIQLC